ncbi:transglycosylase SLT domain-containing protein [uncultured Flavobacterium sp.]|uniref:lytic transglycosylase domain-containing protein n=1 Tax=uncultured Flavobacterium sp. TaxID=165435 RepID=UPI0030CA51EA|tara:strand:+ start:503 stop:1993 length:1491 start_codon:yes stop_codon:yes gene_type:complete
MNFKKLFLILIPFMSFAQESQQDTLQLAFLEQVPSLENTKASFVDHSTSNCIDGRWMEELSNQELFEEMYADVSELNIDETVSYEMSTDLFKENLKLLDAKSPFNIAYNTSLENVIKKFLKNRTASFERLMAISEYYFPMFEEYLAKYDVPLEIKYLAIVESALNPQAKSRVGASGLWQFMYTTGKQFNLEVNSYVDERYDPLKATEAACQYLSSLYKIFGDWSLVLASYNAGPGNVSKAIRRSGGSQNFWNIRKHLPRETANYVPAFLATMYIYEYKKELGIKPQKAKITYFETDTLMVKRQMSFKQISDLFDIPEEQIAFLNPIYKLQIIPFTKEKGHFLRLPKDKIGLFVSNEDKVYEYIDYVKNEDEQVVEFSGEKDIDEPNNKLVYHTVKRGENLGLISDRYNISVANLKKWNNLKTAQIQSGKKLMLYSSKKAESNTDTAYSLSTYTVRQGDSFYSIAKKIPGVSADDIKKWNGISGNNIKPGMKLKLNG